MFIILKLRFVLRASCKIFFLKIRPFSLTIDNLKCWVATSGLVIYLLTDLQWDRYKRLTFKVLFWQNNIFSLKSSNVC